MDRRISELELSIREGEMRLTLPKQTGKNSIRRAVANARIRLQRVIDGLPEGEMIWDNGWKYEYQPQ